ncbi:MAG TPA: ELWxxDGT repeat protein, partial [Thermoguttaceae bacterium]|nr:ELWxxDGT repeat protein [Thermoguttaceae bacterium]
MSQLSLRRHLSLEPLEDRRLLAAMPQALADVDLGFAVIDSDNIVQVGSTLFFAATNDANGTELWRSDGTAAGTALVLDINAGSNSSSPSDLTAVDGVLFFSAREDTHGRELWRSDGTADGTVLVSDIYAGTNSSNPDELIDVDGTLYFSAYESTNGRELRRSDGTADGTVLVANINPGSNNADPQELFNLNDTVYFSAVDGVHGRELWSTDGTAAGTSMVADIFVGALSSDPQELSDFGGRLFFTADDGSGYRKPFVLSSTAVDDAYTMAPNEELVVAAADGVLANDVDVTADSAALVSGPSNGTVALDADGSFTYHPLPDFVGTDSFTYRAQDGTAATNIATVTIYVIEPLGPIVLKDVTSVNPAIADLWYSVETTRPGFLTVEASGIGAAEGVELALFGDTDFTGTPLATSTVFVDPTKPLDIPPDVSNSTATGQAAGALDPFLTYRYRITFADALIGAPTSNQSPASSVVGPITLNAIQGGVALSGIPVDPNGEATSRRIYRSSDGGTTYYFIGEIADNTTTTFTDQLSEAAAAANPQLTETVVGISRLDYLADAAGETLYVCVTGAASDVDLRFANLVQPDGNLVTVYGTQNDDTFDFTPGDTTHLVTIDGLQYEFDAAVIDSVVFEADEWVTETVDLSGTLLATGTIADTAEILQT